MSNLSCNLKFANNTNVANKRVKINPVNAPFVDGNNLAVGDGLIYYTDASGSLTGSLVPGIYSLEVDFPNPNSIFYVNVDSSNTTLISGSNVTGSIQTVIYDLETFDINNYTKQVDTQPYISYPYSFSQSIYIMNATSSIPTSGSFTYNLNPGVYKITSHGITKNTFAINVPADGGPYYISQLIVANTSSIIPVKLYDADKSYCYTVSSSDAIFVKINGTISSSISSSYASSSTSASYSLSSSYAQNATNAVNASNSTSASYAQNATSARYSLESNHSSLSDYATSAGNAKDILVIGKNDNANTITKGKVVRVSGANGANLLFDYADWGNDTTSADTIGFLTVDTAKNDTGSIMTEGTLIGVNTDAFVAGDVLYLSSSGTITNIKPIPPKHGVRLGYVLRSNQNNGVIYVSINNGYELDELHDVLISSASVTNGDLLIRSGSLWINSKILTGSYTLSGSLTTNDGIICNSVTASLYGTASWAQTASYAANAGSSMTTGSTYPITSSWAQSSSVAQTIPLQAKIILVSVWC